MKPVAFRVGILAALVSRFHGGKWIGVMITASHNPIADNGIKLVDPQGEMVIGEWETIATELANVSESNLPDKLAELLQANESSAASAVQLVLARDTRPSGPELSEAVHAGVLSVFPGAQVRDLGEQTTPELHFNTFVLNSSSMTYVASYIEHFSSAFEALLNGKKLTGQLVVDAANGVGAENVKRFTARLAQSTNFNPILINSGEGELNEGVRNTHLCLPFNCFALVWS